jgi:hypothetical protein
LPVTSKTGLTESQLKEYNSIVDETVVKNDKDVLTASGYHVNMPNATFKGTPEQRNMLFDLYKQMNLQQRRQARVGFLKKWDGPKKRHLQMSNFKNGKTLRAMA